MSSLKFVECNADGFWAYDVALGVFLKHLIDIAEERQEDITGGWLKESVAWWRVVACVGDFGLRIDPNWSAVQLSIFTSLAGEACARISRRKSFAATDLEGWSILDGKGIFPRGAREIHTAPIVELGEAIVALVTGVLSPAPRGTVWLYGTPSGRTTIATRERT